jgi:hypothetical protein
MSGLNIELIFVTIHEDSSSITFDPPLKVNVAQRYTDENSLFLDFDFGLSMEISVGKWKLKGEPENDNERIERVRDLIEFELFHSFFHCNFDPNYSTLNWALFGNLAHRATCQDKIVIDYQTGEEEEECWIYGKDLSKQFYD